MEFRIHKLNNGGYLVSDQPRDCGYAAVTMFASTTLDEALKFVKSKLEPKERR